MQDTDKVWSWSESFTEILESLIREPGSDGVPQLDWPGHRERLGWWRCQVDEARELYRQGHAEALQVLYDYWRTIADDSREQARFACETYRQFYFVANA